MLQQVAQAQGKAGINRRGQRRFSTCVRALFTYLGREIFLEGGVVTDAQLVLDTNTRNRIFFGVMTGHIGVLGLQTLYAITRTDFCIQGLQIRINPAAPHTDGITGFVVITRKIIFLVGQHIEEVVLGIFAQLAVQLVGSEVVLIRTVIFFRIGILFLLVIGVSLEGMAPFLAVPCHINVGIGRVGIGVAALEQQPDTNITRPF